MPSLAADLRELGDPTFRTTQSEKGYAHDAVPSERSLRRKLTAAVRF